MTSNPVNKDDPAYIGNQLIVRKEYEKALDAYSLAIEQYPDVAKLYSNRALAYWKLNRPYDAWKDTEAGLKIEPNNEKLIYRKCTALLEMRRFHEASQFLDEGLKRLGHFPEKHTNEFKTLIDDINRLKEEYVDGQYDLVAMVQESKASPILGKHADFYAWNKFEIREVEGKGRGLVAKERIELGEILIACKAFVFIPCGEESATFDVMLDEIRETLLHRPDLGEQFYRLYAGPELSHLDNWMEGEPMDLERIAEIIQNSHLVYREVLFEGTIEPKPHHVGINLVPSYMNHTCVDSNCARYFVGNFTFIRSTKSIEKGEELLISYSPPDLPFEDRQLSFASLDFECHCRLCEIERHDSVEVKKRLEQMRQFLIFYSEYIMLTHASNPHSFRKFEGYVKELRGYRPGISLDYLVIRVRKAMAMNVFLSDPIASIPLWKELIEDLILVGDFLEALYLTKTFIKNAAVRSKSQREQAKCDKLAREIAKAFFHDERVADLHW